MSRMLSFQITTPEVKNFSQILEINNDNELNRAVKFSQELIERMDDGEEDLESVLDAVGVAISAYEKPYGVGGQRLLRFLMEQNGHKLKDMEDVAPMSVVSNILNGQRKLNVGQIERLSHKYGVSPSLFFDVK